MPPEANPLHNFFAKVDFDGPGGCWLWMGGTDKDGYGKFQVALGNDTQAHIRAHRYAYAMAYGDLEAGLEVCHSCDRPPCVNPEHLWQGTTQENTADRVAKNRSARVWGSALVNARKTRCKRGHALSGTNLRVINSMRVCRTCVAFRARRAYWRQKGVTDHVDSGGQQGVALS